MKAKNEMKAKKRGYLHLVALLFAGGVAIAGSLNCNRDIQNNHACGSPVPFYSTNSYVFGTCSDDVVCITTTTPGSLLFCSDGEYTATAPYFTVAWGVLWYVDDDVCSPGPCHYITGTAICS